MGHLSRKEKASTLFFITPRMPCGFSVTTCLVFSVNHSSVLVLVWCQSVPFKCLGFSEGPPKVLVCVWGHHIIILVLALEARHESWNQSWSREGLKVSGQELVLFLVLFPVVSPPTEFYYSTWHGCLGRDNRNAPGCRSPRKSIGHPQATNKHSSMLS